MDVVCFDIATGGISAARFDHELRDVAYEEVAWTLRHEPDGTSTLPMESLNRGFDQLLQSMQSHGPVAAISVASFMHSYLPLDSSGSPIGPLQTWMDSTAEAGVSRIRESLGPGFHPRTGCHYHPMFPVFKVAAHPLDPTLRIASVKSYVLWRLTGVFVEDFGMASASGLLNIHMNDWDPRILWTLGLSPRQLPRLVERDAVIGKVRGVPVVAGSGDGFLATLGSGCEETGNLALTIGTSASVRQSSRLPFLDPRIGTFCYRATQNSVLLGCASSNGGNVLDWAVGTFGEFPDSRLDTTDVPMFFPWIHGERSFEWDPGLKPRWYGLESRHAAPVRARAVCEGVAFNLTQYVEVLQQAAGVRADRVVLSGNGCRHNGIAALLASLLAQGVALPEGAGLATLRGAAVLAWRGLGHDPGPSLALRLEETPPLTPQRSDELFRRYELFKRLRAQPSGGRQDDGLAMP